MADQRKTQQKKKTAKKIEWSFPLTRRNWYILATGVAVIIIGFLLMTTAITSDPQKHQQAWDNPLAISVAPVVLLIGFLVIIPYGLFSRAKTPEPPQQEQ